MTKEKAIEIVSNYLNKEANKRGTKAAEVIEELADFASELANDAGKTIVMHVFVNYHPTLTGITFEAASVLSDEELKDLVDDAMYEFIRAYGVNPAYYEWHVEVERYASEIYLYSEIYDKIIIESEENRGEDLMPPEIFDLIEAKLNKIETSSDYCCLIDLYDVEVK